MFGGFRLKNLRKGFSRFVFLEAIRTDTPVNHFGLVDEETGVIGWGQARSLSDSAIDINRFPTVAANEMVVIVSRAILVAGGRTSRLDATDEKFLGQHAENVVNRLSGNRADLRADIFGDIICCGMRSACNCTKNSQALRGYRDTVSTKKVTVRNHLKRDSLHSGSCQEVVSIQNISG